MISVPDRLARSRTVDPAPSWLGHLRCQSQNYVNRVDRVMLTAAGSLRLPACSTQSGHETVRATEVMGKEMLNFFQPKQLFDRQRPPALLR